VSSISDLGVGFYRVNMTTAMPDDKFVALVSGSGEIIGAYQMSTSTFEINSTNTSGTYIDISPVMCAVLR
jgi:hypothetical protein